MTRLAPLLLLLASCASSGGRPEVYLFITTDCPIANSFAPEIQRIVADYESRAWPSRWSTRTGPRKRSASTRRSTGTNPRYGWTPAAYCPVKYGVTVTPEAVVVAGGARIYRGRIDDRYLAPGHTG